MGFAGDVRSMALDEVFGFLAQNGLTGGLSVQSGDEVSLNLYFKDGVMFFPDRSRRGTYNLGRILRHTGVLSRDGLRQYLLGLSERKKELAAQEDSPEVQNARRLQFTEEIHDLFLWGDARFDFKPGPWPARVEADHKARRGLVIPVSSLLMDVARREDERRRIRASIPSSRLILRTAEGRREAVLRALKGVGVDLQQDPFAGQVELDQLLRDWGVPHHETLTAVGILVEQGDVAPLPLEETRAQVRAELERGDLQAVGRLLGHWAEVRGEEGERFALDLEQETVTSSAFREGPEQALRLRLAGPRLFSLLRLLISLELPFSATLHHRGVELRLVGLPGELYLAAGPRRDPPCPPLLDYLVKLGSLKKKVAQAYREHAPEERPALKTLVSPGQYAGAALAKLADEVAEVGFWARADVELRNRAVRGDPPPGGDEPLELGLDEESRAGLLEALSGWAEVFESVPGEDAVFIAGKRADQNDPAARFFQRFALDQNLGELRRKAQTTSLEFARFVRQGLGRGYLARPRPDQLSVAIADARGAGNDVLQYRLALAGQVFGYAGYQQLVRRLARETDLPQAYPGLEGDLDGVGLGAVLQALRNHRRTGTLLVRAGRREEKLYFHRGDAFLMRLEDGDGDAFVAFFLGDEGADSINELTESEGQLGENQVDGEELAALKSSFLDVLLWDGSTFAWFPNSLPEEFYTPGQSATKIALNTDMFLLEAIQTMGAWEEVAEVIGGGASTFHFLSAEGKLAAIRDRGHPEVLTLIDGRLTFDDLARISGVPRLEVGQLLADLVREQKLQVERPSQPVGTARMDAMELPDPIMD
ncbi:MAG: DUF4388 domain-containing protein [Planctomycetota bacterium]